MIIEVTIPREIVNHLTVEQVVEMNLTGVPVSGGGAGEAFPVGSVFISVIDTNPAGLLGYGTWEQFGAGRVLAGIDPADPDFATVEQTGGAKNVQSSPQSFAGDKLPDHQHAAQSAGTPSGTLGTADRTDSVRSGPDVTVADKYHTHAFIGNRLPVHQHDKISAGTPSGTNTPGEATSVIQPYIVVFMWKRTA